MIVPLKSVYAVAAMILLLLSVACTDRHFVHGHYYNAQDTNRIPHVIHKERFGDSEMIITEKRWRKYIYHYIDVKGSADDGFDNSFTRISKYRLKRKDTAAVMDGKTVVAKKILIESYKTEFSEGKCFYFITATSDTVLYNMEQDGCVK